MLLAAAAVVLGTAGPASAHARLVASSPAAGGTARVAPPTVSVTFDEAVQSSFALVSVVGANGGRLDTGAPRVAGAVVTQRVVPLPAPGSYHVSYRVVSDDGHPVTGALSFRFAPSSDYRPTTSTAKVNSAPARAGSSGGGIGGPGRALVLGVVVVLAGGATLALDRSRSRA